MERTSFVKKRTREKPLFVSKHKKNDILISKMIKNKGLIAVNRFSTVEDE